MYSAAAGPKIHIFTTKNAPAAAGELQRRETSGGREITYVAFGNIILVNENRVSGGPNGEGPVAFRADCTVNAQTEGTQ